MQTENLGSCREQAVLHAVCGEGQQGLRGTRSALHSVPSCVVLHARLCCGMTQGGIRYPPTRP